MKVLKFGGKSLANGSALEAAKAIIQKAAQEGKIIVVLSARGNATNELELLLDKATSGSDYSFELNQFIEYQTYPCNELKFEAEFSEIERILNGVALLGEYSLKIKDRLLSFGEILSCLTVTECLKKDGLQARFVDARSLIKTDQKYGSAHVLFDISEKNIQGFFENSNQKTIEVLTGFIGSNLQNQTTTLGRNGSNYTATLIASFLHADEVQNWTNVDGLYTANPDLVKDARIIRCLSFREANELANFGTYVLHAKTILPLIEKKIPIRILNSFNPEDAGTLINSEGDGKGIKAVTVIDNVALVSIEGRGLLGKIGIDGRIFSSLSKNGVSVRIISQASSERGIGFIVDSENAEKSKYVLNEEFAKEKDLTDIDEINVNLDISVVSVIGKNLHFLDKSYGALDRNGIRPYLIANTINGEHVSLVIEKRHLKKAVNVIHSHIFGAISKLNVFIFGKGNVGGALIQQLISTQERILERRNLKLNIFGIGDTQRILLKEEGVGSDWLNELKTKGEPNYSYENLFQFVEKNSLENAVIIDTTGSKELAFSYSDFVKHGFDIVAANKHANTLEYIFYKELRETLKANRKNFYYETNVGAGLPLIDTIKLLHVSGDKIYKIRGVFSGSLSYVFNNFSQENVSFHDVLSLAVQQGLTEPDPREDLSGNDVGRKLLILARELDMVNNLEDVDIQNLIPNNIQNDTTLTEFMEAKDLLNDFFNLKKKNTRKDHVLRYVGELEVSKGTLKVHLDAVPKDTVIGSLKGSDSIFEIYTESYGEHPLVIRGAGAGAEVTARGVFSDLLRLAETI